jgi:hypothetical protein
MPADHHLNQVPSRHKEAWLLLVAALGLHVADEALTGFLDFYNPLVVQLRAQLGWWPMPTFTFGVWLGGLIALVIVLALFTPVVLRGGFGAWAASYVLSAIMLLNGIGHLVGSAYFQRWLPGATSAPLLIAASLLLARTTGIRRRSSRLATA